MAFDQARADLICQMLATGDKSLRAICEEVGTPKGTFLGWVFENKELADQYARARMTYVEGMADDIHFISDTQEKGITRTTKADGGIEEKEGDMIEHRRLRIEARKWLLGKIAPKKYGDKLALAGDGESPLTVVVRKLTDAG